MKKSYYVLLFSLLLLSDSALALRPVDGWWYNPVESGRGWNIEIQDDILFVSSFLYEPGGAPLWYSANGVLTFDAGAGVYRFSAALNRFSNGQCMTCPYQEPVLQPGAGGPIAIVFDSPTTATLTWNGGIVPISRFYWAFDDPIDFMFGQWHLTAGASDFDAEIIVIDATTRQNGNTLIAGNRYNDTARRLAGGYSDEDQEWSLVLDINASEFKIYIFQMTKDAMEGRMWQVPKSNPTPTGAGEPMIGHRILSAGEVGADKNTRAALLADDDDELLEAARRQLR